MKKPNAYNETQAGGGYIPVAVGGHYAIIKRAEERQDKNGRDMVVVAIDFTLQDAQAGYMSTAFLNDVRPNKKWPNSGMKYISVLGWQSSDCSKDFKGFCEAVEKSNKGFTINWEAKDWCAQFANKKVGVVYGNVESEYNGKTSIRPEIRWFCPYDKVAEAVVPRDKLLNKQVSDDNHIPAGPASAPVDDDCPF